MLPVLVAVSFAQYALDSRALRGRALRASRLGRYNGIGYFVLVGVAVISAALGLRWQALAGVVGWLLVATSVLSMLDRAVAFRNARRPP